MDSVIKMQRKVFHPQRNERLKQLLDEYGIKPYSLTSLSKARKDCSPEERFGKEIYDIVAGRRELTENNAKKVLRLAPQLKDIRFQWLMCYDDIKTYSDMAQIDRLIDIMNAAENSRQSKFYGLNLFLRPYGYRIIDCADMFIPPMKEKLDALGTDSDEYLEVLKDMRSALDIEYAVVKDGEIVARLSADTLNDVYDTAAEMIALIFSRL